MGGSLPSLMRFLDEHHDRKDEFVILAFHDDRVASFEELDEKLGPIVEKKWKGRALPFPILLDSTGKTLETWGIEGFPTTVLIDPQGRIVGEAGEEALEKALGEKKLPRQGGR